MPPERAPFATLSKGDALPAFPLTIGEDDLRAYLDATGEPAERWGELVPPLMLGALMLGGLMERIEIPAGVMHTGQEHQAHRAVRVGESLEVRITVASHGERRGAVLASFDAEARAGNEVVATARTSVMVPPPGDEGAPE